MSRKVDPVSATDMMELRFGQNPITRQETPAATQQPIEHNSIFDQMFTAELERLRKEDLRQGVP